MNVLHKLAAVTAIAGMGFLSGCSSNGGGGDAGDAVSGYARVAPLAAQTALITIGTPTATPTVTVTSQPADLTISGTASFAAGDVTVNLTAVNNAGRVISNMKAVIETGAPTNLQGGTISGSDGTVASGDSFVYFNEDADSSYIKSVADGASADSNDLVITTAAATDITLSVIFPTQDATLLVGGNFGGGSYDYYTVDSSNAGSDFEHDGSAHAFGAYSTAAGFRASAASPDGTKFFLGTRQMPQVVVHDNTTGTSTHVNIARDGRLGAIHGLTVSPDGKYLYVSLIDGAHSAPWNTGAGTNRIWLVKMRIDKMEEIKALELTTAGGSQERLQQLTITPDGKMGAAPLFNSGKVAVVDLDSMKLETMLDVTQVTKATATPPVFGGAAIKPRWSAISPDGAYVYVAHQYDYDDTTGLEGSLEVYNVADGTGAAVALTSYNAVTPRGLEFGADGRLYYTRDQTNPLSIFTFTAEDYSMPTAELEVAAGIGSDAFAFGPYGDYYYVMNQGTSVYKFDILTDALVDTIAGISGDRYHVLSVSAY